MNAWIESVMDLMTVGGSAMSFSLSDARFLVPDARICWALGMAVALWVFCAWDNRWQTHVHGRESDRG